MKKRLCIAAVIIAAALLAGCSARSEHGLPKVTSSSEPTSTASSVSSESVTTTSATSAMSTTSKAVPVPEDYIDVYDYDADISNIDLNCIHLARDEEDFYAYLGECVEKGYNIILQRVPVDMPMPDTTDIIDRFSLPYGELFYADVNTDTDGSEYDLIETKVKYYTGLEIEKAFETNDASKLDEKSLEVYVKILPFISGLQGQTDRQKALNIAKYICESTVYENYDNFIALTDDITTMYGVIINGSANCQGYADTFQTLCRMAGLQSSKVTGTANDSKHVWNTVMVDGKWYMADTVWMDTALSDEVIYYGTFLSGVDYMSADHSWEPKSIHQDIVEISDENYLCNDPLSGAVISGETNETQAAKLISDGLMSGRESFDVLCTNECDMDMAVAIAKKTLEENYYYNTIYTYSYYMGDYLYQSFTLGE